MSQRKIKEPPDWMNTFRVFDCSTAHMTAHDSKMLQHNTDLVLCDYDYGAFIFVLEGAEESAINLGFSSAFVNLIRVARDAGCQYMALDGDGQVYPDLPKFEW